jgi:hypothetical protein
MFQVEFFWVVTPCRAMVGYQRFGGPFHLTLNMEAAWTSEILVSYHGFTTLKTSNITQRRRRTVSWDMSCSEHGNAKYPSKLPKETVKSHPAPTDVKVHS